MDVKEDAPSLSDEGPLKLDDLPLSELISFIGDGGHDLQTLISFASCSKSWQQKVYRGAECRDLWRTIDFGKIGPDRNRNIELRDGGHSHFLDGSVPVENAVLVGREKLSDASLAALLRRVDARSITERLILRGCKLVTGTGIEPLRGSSKLREVDLRFAFDDCYGQMVKDPDVDAIENVLRSMKPFTDRRSEPNFGGLQIVKSPLADEVFRHSHDSRKMRELRHHTARMKRLMNELKTKLAARMKFCQEECSFCSNVLYDQLVSNTNTGTDASEAERDACKMCEHLSAYKRNLERREWEGWMVEDNMPVHEEHHTKAGFKLVAADLKCHLCNRISCGQNDCPDTRRCKSCSIQTCAACLEMAVCREYSRSFSSNLIVSRFYLIATIFNPLPSLYHSRSMRRLLLRQLPWYCTMRYVQLLVALHCLYFCIM